MSEYSGKIEIDVPADDVFAYVTNVTNMPQYLPTLKKATPLGDNRIQVVGEENGRPYEADGWYQVHEFERAMLWGSEGANRYTGDLEVMHLGNGCQLSITLKFEPTDSMDPKLKEALAHRGEEIQNGLEQSLQSIKKACESSFIRTGKPTGYVL